MNKMIAEAFASIISVIHFVIIVIVFATKIPGADANTSILLKVIALVIYVFFVGLVSTLISINEHLADLNEKTSKPTEK